MRVVGGLLLLFVPTIAAAQLVQPWEFAVGPAGEANKQFTAGALGTNLQLGRFITRHIELSVRETLYYSSFPNGTNWLSTTKLALEWQFNFGGLHPFVGPQAGYGIGIHNTSSFEWGGDAGVKVDVGQQLFFVTMVEYDAFLRKRHSDLSTGIRNNAVVIFAGIGFRW